MSPYARAQLQIHACVVLWGFTAILGRAIMLPALALVWWRMLAVTALLALVPRVRRAVAAMPARLLVTYAGIGCVVALHWLSFYGSIKVANASVAATCIALAPVFLSVVEPLVTGKRFSTAELALGVLVLPGVALVVGGTPGAMRWGLVLGALSALLVAVFGALNKLHVHEADPLAVTCVELGAVGVAQEVSRGQELFELGAKLAGQHRRPHQDADRAAHREHPALRRPRMKAHQPPQLRSPPSGS